MAVDKANSGCARQAVNEFFSQTFRLHTRNEYSELITRGLGSKHGANKRYPWAYIRLFTLLFVLYAVFILIVRFTSNQLFLPTIAAFGAVFVNLPFLLLLYELYPQRDISFMSVCLVMLIGGAGANVLTQIFFSLIHPSSKWLDAVAVGVFEEVPKALATVIVIVSARKHSPLAGFIFGAAVGCGFSVAEDMGYILVQAGSVSPFNLATVVEVTVARGVTAFCTHTLWTAAVGWAYCLFSRHTLANIVFYAVLLLSCGLHIAWDLPLAPLPIAFVDVGCGVVAVVECTLILHFERRRAYVKQIIANYKQGNSGLDVKEAWELAMGVADAEKALDRNKPSYWSYWSKFTFVFASFLMAVAAVIYCSVPFQETYGTQKFSSPASFVTFMQDGMIFNYTENRAYNSHDTANDVELRENGRLIQVTQRVKDVANGDITYNYVYTVGHDDTPGYEKDYFYLNSVYLSLSTELGERTVYREEVFNNGVKYASFFRVRTDVTGFMFDSNGDVSAIIYNPAFVMDLSDWKYLSLFIVFGTLIGSALICGSGLQIKSRRIKKLCSTQDASFAE